MLGPEQVYAWTWLSPSMALAGALAWNGSFWRFHRSMTGVLVDF